MKHQHLHCGCEEDRSDFRRGRYEPGEPPEVEPGVRRDQPERAVQQPEPRTAKLRRQR